MIDRTTEAERTSPFIVVSRKQILLNDCYRSAIAVISLIIVDCRGVYTDLYRVYRFECS